MRESVERPKNRQSTFGEGFKGYFRPHTVEEAVGLMARIGEDLKVLAGGTDLLVEYFEHLAEVKGWLDLEGISELKEIKLNKEEIEIGAMVTHSQLEKSELILKHFPVLKQAAADVGSPQIRNRGTIGGNIVTASPAGDLIPPLIAYGANLSLNSVAGEKEIPLKEFFLGPKKSVLKPEELVTKIKIPLPDSNTYGSWFKVGKRKALIISSISLAVVINFYEDKTIKDFRACFGSAAPTPIRIKEFAEITKDKRLADLDFKELGRLAAIKIVPIDDLRGTKEYRQDVANNIMIRVLQDISERVK